MKQPRAPGEGADRVVPTAWDQSTAGPDRRLSAQVDLLCESRVARTVSAAIVERHLARI